MAIMKCKICGGNLEVTEGKTFGICEYCGSTMMLPKVSDEQRIAAFNRGNHFRSIGEFDQALAVYERIVAEDDTDAEAHWCCALCRFGIEYVEDPVTYEWIPTCHRASFDSFLEDVDYLSALQYSDGLTRRQYQKDAAKIAEVQRGILATSQNEEPFDVFLCYKESDEGGERTVASTLAQDIYYQLTDQGRRVFFARITLEDKVGSEYEPYIFAALNSAKVMIVVGTNPEHFNAVWVKNEWSRFLSLMRHDRTRLLLPCYRDMDPYDLPSQLNVLQSYDMAKIGFIQDLIRGVSKVLDAGKMQPTPSPTPAPAPAPVPVTETVRVEGRSATPLIKRGYMALEDGEWSGANAYFDEALNLEAESSDAYLGKALARYRVADMTQLTSSLSAQGKKSSAETIAAGEADEERLARIVRENEVAEYLSAEDIKKRYRFDFSIKSEVSDWQQRSKKTMEMLRADRDLYRAQQFADAKKKAQLEQCIRTVEESYQAKIEEAEREKSAAMTQKMAQYEAYLVSFENEMKERRQNALQAKMQAEKKKKNTNIISLCFFGVAALAIAIICIVSSVRYHRCGEDLTWSLKEGTLTIEGTGDMQSHPWSERKSEQIQAVVVEDGCTSICDRAFQYCSNLAHVSLPESVTSIGEYAFHGCGFVYLSLPNSVTRIENSAFQSCYYLKSIALSDRLTDIGDNAFGYCENLMSITLPEGVTRIGEDAFVFCTTLTNIEIPGSVKTIGDGAFAYCDRLTQIVAAEENTSFASWDGILFSKDLSALICYPAGREETGFAIPHGITTIDACSFQGCEYLVSVSIPETVTRIGSYAFSGCFALADAALPYSVTNIGDGAFADCNGLVNAVIPYGVTRIGDSTFYSCDMLASVVIPETVTSIGDSAFYGCDALAGVAIPYGVTSIGDSAFEECNTLTGVVIPESVTSIGSEAFAYCDVLTSIVVPYSATDIITNAFDGLSADGTITYAGTMQEWQAFGIAYEGAVLCSDGTL